MRSMHRTFVLGWYLGYGSMLWAFLGGSAVSHRLLVGRGGQYCGSG